MKPFKTTLHIALALPVLLSGCTALLPQTLPALLEKTPATFSSSSTNSVSNSEWWKTFNNDELNALMSTAFSNNLSIAQTAARFRQARASADKLSAATYPALTAAAQAGRSETETLTDDGTSASSSSDNYSIGLAASYELDLWGRVNSLRKTASFNSRASFLDLETAAMSLSARIAELWIQIIEAKTRIILINRQIETNSQTLDLLKHRAAKSNTTLLDVYQQEQQLRTTEARLPPAKQNLELLMNQLAVLLGRHPDGSQLVASDELPHLPQPPDNGIPADLLNNRPDVKAGRMRLQSAAWSTSSARADRLPALRLTAKQDFASSNTSTLFDNWISNLAAGLTAPLLDGGLKRAEIRRAQAALDENIASYRETILNAVRDVEDALVREKRSAETQEALTRQLTSSGKALNEALNRYKNGSTSYLSVLTSLRSVHQTEQELTLAKSSLLLSRIALHRALGGTWTESAAQKANERDLLTELKTSDKDSEK